MRWYGVLFFTALLLWLPGHWASAADTSPDQATLNELWNIFETQKLIVNDLNNDLQKVSQQLKRLKHLRKEDSAEYETLKSDYNELSKEHERAMKLLQDLRTKLSASQAARRAFENSLKEANASLKSAKIKAWAVGAGVGAATATALIIIIQN